METVLLIDGENFKGKIKSIFKEAGKERPVWHEYDFKGLLDKVLGGLAIDRKVFYFARMKEHQDSREKSKQLIEEQRYLKDHLEKLGFEVILSGRVRGQWEDGQGGKKMLVFREKGVDVKVAVDMVSLSCDKKVKEIILGSSDSDLQPAIKEVRDRNISCVYLGFESQPNKGLTYTTNRTLLLRNAEILEFEKMQATLMNEMMPDKETLKKKLEEEGFPYVYEWHDELGTKYPAHAHKDKVSMYILSGGLTFYFGQEVIELKAGDRFDVPPEKEHSAVVGAEGCDFLVGEMIEGDS